jgi:hypothetical protein
VLYEAPLKLSPNGSNQRDELTISKIADFEVSDPQLLLSMCAYLQVVETRRQLGEVELLKLNLP